LGRPGNKRGQRLGRNQYTRDNPSSGTATSPGRVGDVNSPFSPPNKNGNGVDGNASDSAGRQTKARNLKLEKMSWNEIRRPANAMLNYIQQRQVELAEKGNGGMPSNSTTSASLAVKPLLRPAGESSAPDDLNEEEDLEKFKNLTSVEMMDHLSRELELWHQTVKDFEKMF
jgi:hypothetical protein